MWINRIKIRVMNWYPKYINNQNSEAIQKAFHYHYIYLVWNIASNIGNTRNVAGNTRNVASNTRNVASNISNIASNISNIAKNLQCLLMLSQLPEISVTLPEISVNICNAYECNHHCQAAIYIYGNTVRQCSFSGFNCKHPKSGRGGSYFGGGQDVVLVRAEADVIHPIIVTLIKFNFDK